MAEFASAILPALPLLLNILRAGLALGLVLAVVNVVRLFRRSRSAPYFILRRAAAGQAARWVLVLVVTAVGLVFALRARAPDPASLRPAITPTAIVVVTPAPSPTPDATPPTAVASASPVPPATTAAQGTQTPVSSGLVTLVPSPTEIFVTRESDVTPDAGASITITAVSTGITPDFLPQDAGTAFPAGAARFYVFFDFAGMTDGASWSGAVLINGAVYEDVSFDQLWTTGEEGTNLYWWFDRDDGWPAGEYEVRFFVGDQLAASVTFRML